MDKDIKLGILSLPKFDNKDAKSILRCTPIAILLEVHLSSLETNPSKTFVKSINKTGFTLPQIWSNYNVKDLNKEVDLIIQKIKSIETIFPINEDNDWEILKEKGYPIIYSEPSKDKCYYHNDANSVLDELMTASEVDPKSKELQDFISVLEPFKDLDKILDNFKLSEEAIKGYSDIFGKIETQEGPKTEWDEGNDDDDGYDDD